MLLCQHHTPTLLKTYVKDIYLTFVAKSVGLCFKLLNAYKKGLNVKVA